MNEREKSQGKEKPKVDQAKVDQKLKLIRMVLRGDDFENQMKMAHYTQILNSLDQGDPLQNQHLIIESKEYFVPNKLKSVQLSNRKMIETQRQMLQTLNISSLDYVNQVLPKIELTGRPAKIDTSRQG